MDEQKKKAPVWLSLFPAGKPAHKRRMELKKIKDTMKELEVDVEGFDLDTEENFRDFVMAKKTPQSDFELFLKKIFADNAIEYTDREFKKLRKKDCLDVFFEVFTLGLGKVMLRCPWRRRNSPLPRRKAPHPMRLNRVLTELHSPHCSRWR